MTDFLELVLLLKKSPMFSEVFTEDLRVVAGAVQEEQYFKGDRIFEIDQQGDSMYILAAGRVGISVQPDPRSSKFIAELGPGDCFGEMGMFDDMPRSATATVLEDATVLVLGKDRLRGLLVRYPQLALGLLRGLSLRLRTANAWARGPA